MENIYKKEYMINTYDCCVTNKIIEGKKCTIVWYFDDNKALHVNPKAIGELISDLKVYFEDLLITRGNKHYFMGMNI